MDYHYLILILVFVCVFAFIGFFKKQYALILFSGILLFFMALWIINGVSISHDFITNSTSTQHLVAHDGHNDTVTTTLYQEVALEHEPYKNTFTTTLGIIFILVGLGFILIAGIQVLQPPKNIEVNDDSDDLDE